MNTIITVTSKDVTTILAMISDLETGYMANHSGAADKRRFKYESFLRTLLDRVHLDSTQPAPDRAGKE